MTPALAAAGNATGLLVTGAYELGGVPAAAATGAAVVASATAAVVRRRNTVRRSMATRAPRGSTLPGRGGMFGPSRTGGGGAGGFGSGLGSTHGTPGRGGSTGLGNGAGRGGAGTAPGRGTAGLLGTGTNTKGPGAGPRGAGGSGSTGNPGAGSGPHSTGRNNGAARNKKGGHRAPGHGLRAWATRTARSAATRATAPGSLPRRAATTAMRNAALRPGTLTRRAAVRARKTAAPYARSTVRRAMQGVRRTVRAAGTARGALWDGALATTAGVLSGLWHRDRHAALERLRDVWRRRRQRRADRNTPTEPTETTATAAAPAVTGTVRRPTATTGRPAATAGGSTVSGHHFVAPAMEMARIAASYSPTGMLQVGEDFAGLEEAMRLIADSVKITVERADAEDPLAPQIIEMMRQIYALQLKIAEMSGELRPAFENLHQVDLQRLRSPRKGAAGERKWDVASNL